MKPLKVKGKSYDPYNRQASQEILANVEKYGGEQSLAVRWAKLWMERNHGKS